MLLAAYRILEASSDGALEVVLNELLVFSRLINLLQLSNAGVISVSLGGNENVQEGVVVALDEEGILGGVQLSQR